MVISYTENNLSYEQLLVKYQLVLNSLKQPQTQTFIDLYFGNNAINTSELAHILPIYKT